LTTIRELLGNIPRPGEVWLVSDEEVRFVPDQNRNFHRIRFVLVVMNDNLCTKDNIVINIVPLTTQGRPDKLLFPLRGEYEDIAKENYINRRSKAAINHYQPIDKKYFMSNGYIGRIAQKNYYAIVELLKWELIGTSDFDLTL